MHRPFAKKLIDPHPHHLCRWLQETDLKIKEPFLLPINEAAALIDRYRHRRELEGWGDFWYGTLQRATLGGYFENTKSGIKDYKAWLNVLMTEPVWVEIPALRGEEPGGETLGAPRPPLFYRPGVLYLRYSLLRQVLERTQEYTPVSGHSEIKEYLWRRAKTFLATITDTQRSFYRH